MAEPVLTVIEVGTVLTVLNHDYEESLCLVNGKPWVVGVMSPDGFTLSVRIPCHMVEINQNLEVAGSNVVKVGWP